jgi:hypothetical protein
LAARRVALRRVTDDSVFLNVPYDQQFKDLYIAYIVGLTELGLQPTATLAIPGGEARLDRIFELIQTCRYSVHDLSRVELSQTPPPTPRFNMPFELGMAVAWAKLHPERHTYIACESVNRRAQKSLSDMAGTDFNIHNGTPRGVMRELCNAFVRQQQRPTVPQMMRRYEFVSSLVPRMMQQNGSETLFEARAFKDLVGLAAYARE